MHTYISLLRGINVGGHRKITMATLQALYASLGFVDPRTYIQSGNVVFRTAENTASPIERKIERAVQRTFGFPVTVMVRSSHQLDNVVKGCPYVRRKGVNINHLAVTFLKSAPPTALTSAMAPRAAATADAYAVAGDTIYLHCPNGFGKTLLTNAFFEKHLKIEGTSRNWRTTVALLSMCNELDARHIGL